MFSDTKCQMIETNKHKNSDYWNSRNIHFRRLSATDPPATSITTTDLSSDLSGLLFRVVLVSILNPMSTSCDDYGVKIDNYQVYSTEI